MFNEFKEFALKGNVMDMAIGIIIGAAFGKIVASFVADIVMPIVGTLMGGIDFTALSIDVGDAVIMYGTFIQTVVDFVIIAFVIFLMVKQMNKMKKQEEEAPATPPADVELLTEIRDLLKK